MAAPYSSFSSSNEENIKDGEGGYLPFYVPPGHRFVPTDCELVEHYLLNKILGRQLPCNIIKYIDSLDLKLDSITPSPS